MSVTLGEESISEPTQTHSEPQRTFISKIFRPPVFHITPLILEILLACFQHE